MAKAQELMMHGKLNEAQAIALEAMAMAESLPPDDRRQGTSLELLTGILYQNKQWQLAEPFMCRLLEMYKRCLGPEHLDTGTVHHNVALMYHSWGRLEQADVHYLQAVKVKSAHLGSDHPDVIVLTGNYAALRSVLMPLEAAMRPREPEPVATGQQAPRTDSLSLTGQFKVADSSEFMLE
jgi:hypothetical protein